MNWRKAREQAGMTQREVAKRIGMTPAAYSLVDRGLQTPQPLTRENLKRVVLEGKPAITREQLEEICKKRYESGETIEQIAKRYHAGEQTVRRWINAPKEKKEPLDEESRKKVMALRKRGHTYKSIADKLGISYDTVRYHCNSNSNPSKSGRKRKKIPTRIVDEWCDLRRNGWTLAEIAKVYNEPVARISKATVRRDDSVRQRGASIDDKTVERAQLMRDKGYTLEEISKKLGYSDTTIGRYTVPCDPIYMVYDHEDTVIATGTLSQIGEELKMSQNAINTLLCRQRNGTPTRRKFIQVGRERVYE